MRNPASSDLPTLLAWQLCAMPHLTVIRGTPAGWMEAGHPEGWEMKRRLAADRRAFEHLERDRHYLRVVLAPSVPQSWGKQIDRH